MVSVCAADELRKKFEPELVFCDVTSTLPGADFADALRQRLDECAAVEIVIGPA